MVVFICQNLSNHIFYRCSLFLCHLYYSSIIGFLKKHKKLFSLPEDIWAKYSSGKHLLSEFAPPTPYFSTAEQENWRPSDTVTRPDKILLVNSVSKADKKISYNNVVALR